MSIEQKIEGLTVALGKLTALIETLAAAQAQKPTMVSSFPTPTAPAPTVAPVAPVAVVPAPAPVAVVAPVVQALPVAAPSFMSAPVVPAGPAVPFTDIKGLITYVTEAYKAMGPDKGAKISEILTHFKYSNINDVQPENYAQFYQFVEQLKAS